MFALLRRLRSVDENNSACRRSLSGSDPGSPPLTPSTKLRDKLEKLAEWRIDTSSIEFEEGACEFCGGFATVSRASLVSTSGTKSSVDDPARARRKNKSDGRPTTRKAVAVKKMKIENGKDNERVLGLALREAGFLIELSHENIVELEGFVEDLSQNNIWLVFSWAANGNLKDFIASEEWEIPERISLSNDVVRGVEYLHSQDPPIYHGDLKSVNILVNSEHRAVITDFGCARRLARMDLDAQREKCDDGAQPVLLLETKICEATNTITLTGNKYTLRWAAPELLMDDEPGLWSDIWALGWIFYEVMTNAIPFHNVQNESMVVIHVIQGNLPCASDHTRISLIRRLYSLMITCWSIDPTKRPTAEDCRKSMNWMPMVVPDPQRASKTSGSRPRSPELLTKLGDMHRLQNDYGNASKFYSEALGISTETADDEKKADALLGLAHIHKLQNKYCAAATFYSEVARICTDIGSKEGRANALFGLAEVHRAQNEYNEAVLYYSEVVQICTDLGNVQRRANALWGLAEVHRARNEYREAVTFYSEVVQIFTDLGCTQQRADALFGLAEVHRAQNEYSEALAFYSEVVQICTDLGIRQGRATALCGLAELHRAQNEYGKAIMFYSEVVQICTKIGNRGRRADALWGLAEVHRLQRKYGEAVTLYSEVVQICTEVGNRQRKADALRGLAHVHLAQDKYREAVALYSEAVQIFTDIGNRGGAADALWGLAEVHRLQKRYSDAVNLFSEALQIRTDIGDRHGRAWALMCLADVHRDQDQHEGAIRLYEQAAEIFEEIGNTMDADKALYRAANAGRQLDAAEAG